MTETFPATTCFVLAARIPVGVDSIAAAALAFGVTGTGGAWALNATFRGTFIQDKDQRRNLRF